MKQGNSAWKKAYLVLRFPVAFGLLGLSALFFFVGLLNSLGYNGTTELRKVARNSQEWINFVASFSGSGEPTAGQPFQWKNSIPRQDGNYILFDKRLINAFEYLKTGASDPKCGWSSKHELLTIDVDYSSQWSIYTKPPEKVTPLSTIYRGVGARVFEADYIKCTIYPRDPARPELCPEAPTAQKFKPEDKNGFPIPLSSNDLIQPTLDYNRSGCRVTCAIDYYPVLGDPLESKPPQYNKEIVDLVKFDPAVTVFEYEDISSYSRKAGLLKSLLLAYELMKIDEPGCQSGSGNKGSDRAIPITLILQDWVREAVGEDGWNDLIKMAEKQFPLGMQRSSRLAALAPEKVLNVFGLHLNY